jgi:hypothetical protein
MYILTIRRRLGKSNFHIPREFQKKLTPANMGAASTTTPRGLCNRKHSSNSSERMFAGKEMLNSTPV